VKKLLMGIALLGAFSFAMAKTRAGQAVEDGIEALSLGTIERLIRQSDGIASTTIGPVAISFSDYSGTMYINPASFVSASPTSLKNGGLNPGMYVRMLNTTNIAGWRDWNENIRDTTYDPPYPPRGTSQDTPWSSNGQCILEATTTFTSPSSKSIPAGTIVTSYWRNTGGFHAYKFEVTFEGVVYNRSAAGLTEANAIPNWKAQRDAYCPDVITLTTWMTGSYPGGQPHPNVAAEARAGYAQWLANEDEPRSSYVAASGITHNPALTTAQLSAPPEPGKGADGVDTSPGSNGGGTIDSDAESGACQQITGNWFTHFWSNIELTLQCMFIPQEDWSDEFTATLEGIKQKAPFGYLAWLPVFTDTCPYGGSKTFVNEIGYVTCYDPTITINFHFPFMDDYAVVFNPWENPLFDWWIATGKVWLWYAAVIGFFVSLIWRFAT
jgi:hypothetical protein